MTKASHWGILRTSGSQTIPLAESLERAGFDVWTPVEWLSVRQPRSKKQAERKICVMPTYVFARADHLGQLAIVRELPISPHPGFSIFHHNGRLPLITERELAPLRAIEAKAAVEHKPVNFPRDTSIRINSGAFEGMTGRVVEETRGQYTLLAFPGFAIPIKFANWQLLDSTGDAKLEQVKPDQGNAAKAA